MISIHQSQNIKNTVIHNLLLALSKVDFLTAMLLITCQLGRPLISDSNIPVMQIGFLPFIPKPVTEHATVYTAMINFVKVLEQLDQKSMPIFRDEGVYRKVVNIYIKCPEKFKTLVPCLGGFHMRKCLEHCIGKNIKGTGLEDALIECKRIGKKRLSKC